MINQFRISNQTIYEWSSSHNAYICIGKTFNRSKEELYKIANSMIDEDTHTIRKFEE